MESLTNDLEKIVKKSEENVSILIKKLNSLTPIYSYNNKIRLISASTIKVQIMLAALNEVKNNNISLDEKILVEDADILDDSEVFDNGKGFYTLYELINWMIIVSDNTATNVIIKKIGMSKINEYILNTLELKSTVLQRYMLDNKARGNGFENYTCQEDMLNTFLKLFNKEILNNELCDKAIQILYNQRHQNQIMRYIYTPVKFAHKTGYLEFLNHDVGVMNINNKYYYVGISVYNSTMKEGNKRLVGILGKVIYNYLKEKN